MSNDNLRSKIELLEDQIENVERSGFFTEKEIDRATFSLRQEKQAFEKQLNTEE